MVTHCKHSQRYCIKSKCSYLQLFCEMILHAVLTLLLSVEHDKMYRILPQVQSLITLNLFSQSLVYTFTYSCKIPWASSKLMALWTKELITIIYQGRIIVCTLLASLTNTPHQSRLELEHFPPSQTGQRLWMHFLVNPKIFSNKFSRFSYNTNFNFSTFRWVCFCNRSPLCLNVHDATGKQMH